MPPRRYPHERASHGDRDPANDRVSAEHRAEHAQHPGDEREETDRAHADQDREVEVLADTCRGTRPGAAECRSSGLLV
jgi:hypothetical protein